MLKHIAMWKMSDDEEEAVMWENAIAIKTGFEELRYEVEGVVSLEVHITPENPREEDADICLEAVFVSKDAFRAYLLHPRHILLDKFVKGCTDSTMRMEFEVL